MRTNAREVYGSGPRLPTRPIRLSKVACMLLVTCILGLLAGAMYG
jgi:hypothetical protein